MGRAALATVFAVLALLDHWQRTSRARTGAGGRVPGRAPRLGLGESDSWSHALILLFGLRAEVSASSVVSLILTVAGIGARDHPERVIAFRRNRCSGSSETGVQDRSGSAFKMLRNTQRVEGRVLALTLRAPVPDLAARPQVVTVWDNRRLGVMITPLTWRDG